MSENFNRFFPWTPAHPTILHSSCSNSFVARFVRKNFKLKWNIRFRPNSSLQPLLFVTFFHYLLLIQFCSNFDLMFSKRGSFDGFNWLVNIFLTCLFENFYIQILRPIQTKNLILRRWSLNMLKRRVEVAVRVVMNLSVFTHLAMVLYSLQLAFTLLSFLHF